MPSRSVEAATRNEAIAAARAEFGPTARVVGVRRIRSGGMFGFFANERYVAEVEAGPAPVAGPDTGSVLTSAVPREEQSAPSMDDRMRELADLLGAAPEQSSAGLYGRSGAVAPAAAPAAARPASRSATATSPATSAPATARSGGAAPASARGTAAAERSAAVAKPFTPARHTLMLAPEDLAPAPVRPVTPAADQPPAPSPFAAALTRMVASTPVQAAADAAADAAAADAAAADAATADAAADQAAAVEAAAADAARAAATRIDAAAAEAARLKAEAAAAEAARLAAAAAAAESARLAAEAAAAEAARAEAEAAAAEAARREAARLETERIEAERIEAERIEAERIEAERIQAEAEAARREAARLAAERIEAERIEAERIEAERIEAERIEAERIEAERIEAERIEAERIEADAVAEADRLRAVAASAARAATPLTMVESVRTADEELATLLEEVLAANGSGRGRHRLPEAGEVPLAAAEAAITQATAVVEAAAAVEDRVLDVPEPWAYENRTAEPSAYDTGIYRTDASAGGWASDARVAQRAAQVAAAQSLVVDAVVVDETPAEQARHVEPRPVEVPAPVQVSEERFAVPVSLSPAMARTASDPAPLPMDATMVLPPLSLMPPQRFGGGQPPLLPARPAVPPARRGRPSVPANRPVAAEQPQVATRPVPIPVPIGSRSTAGALPAAGAGEPGGRLATVTRLVPATSSTALVPFAMNSAEELVVRLLTLGLPDVLLGQDFTADAAARGVYAALTRTLAEHLPAAPQLPSAPGDVLLVIGPGAEAFAAARSLALSLRLDPQDVQWAASGTLAGLAPESSRITSLETAVERQQVSSRTGAVTVVAVDAPLRTSGGPWLEHMLSVWSPSAVWAVLDSTRKPEDLVPWLDGLPRLDAVVVQDTDSTADPAAVLAHVAVPVAVVDGSRATAHRWASLLCERLEELDA